MCQETPTPVQTLFFILGCLDEYLGRCIIEDGDQVERFYASEKDAANTFHAHLVRLAHERQLDPDLEIKVEEDSGGISFHSRALTALIDSCYSFDFSTSAYRASDTEPTRVEAFISRDVFERGDRRAKLSFLAGAYVRYGEGSLFRFANAEHKAELIRDLLNEFGCSQVELVHTNPGGYVPWIFEVRFEPSPELSPWFSKPSASP